MSSYTKLDKAPAPSEAALRRLMIDKAEGSGLDEEDIRRMRLRIVTRSEAAALGLPVKRAGFLIPYFNLHGHPTDFWRVRYLEETRTGFDKLAGRKALRYVQPPNSEPEVYLPPFLPWKEIAENPEIPLIITEGELKAACATKHGYPALGLGGVWSFMSKKAGSPLLPILADSFVWHERTVTVCFDSDVVTNPEVVRAESRLATELTGKGALVKIARLPQKSDVAKMGLDDYVVLYGIERFHSEVLEPAFDFNASAALHKLNEEVVYVRNPGFIWVHDDRLRLPPNSFIQHAYSNRFHTETRVSKTGDITMIKVPTAKAWLEWEYRAEAPRIVYAPGQPYVLDDGSLNVWPGWGVKNPVEGDVSVWHRMMGHVFGPDEEARHYFEQWAAYPLQHPGAKLATGVLIWSPAQGTGKTLVGHTLMRLYGQNATEIKDIDLENERFEWAEYRQFALADDITGQDSRKLANRLKTMITQKQIRVNAKYIPSYTIVDCINYYFTSNDPDAIYLDSDDRRFFVHEVLNGRVPDDLRREFVRWRDSEEGISALFAYLLEVDLSDFDPQAPAPVTISKQAMHSISRSDLGSWVRDLLANPDHILGAAKMTGDLFTSAQLLALYDPAGTRHATANGMARELKRAGAFNPSTGSPLRLSDGRQTVVWVVRNHEYWRDASWSEACKHFEEHQRAKPQSKAKF